MYRNNTHIYIKSPALSTLHPAVRIRRLRKMAPMRNLRMRALRWRGTKVSAPDWRSTKTKTPARSQRQRRGRHIRRQILVSWYQARHSKELLLFVLRQTRKWLYTVSVAIGLNLNVDLHIITHRMCVI